MLRSIFYACFVFQLAKLTDLTRSATSLADFLFLPHVHQLLASSCPLLLQLGNGHRIHVVECDPWGSDAQSGEQWRTQLESGHRPGRDYRNHRQSTPSPISPFELTSDQLLSSNSHPSLVSEPFTSSPSPFSQYPSSSSSPFSASPLLTSHPLSPPRPTPSPSPPPLPPAASSASARPSSASRPPGLRLHQISLPISLPRRLPSLSSCMSTSVCCSRWFCCRSSELLSRSQQGTSKVGRWARQRTGLEG
jgi:hypothetical protein